MQIVVHRARATFCLSTFSDSAGTPAASVARGRLATVLAGAIDGRKVKFYFYEAISFIFNDKRKITLSESYGIV